MSRSFTLAESLLTGMAEPQRQASLHPVSAPIKRLVESAAGRGCGLTLSGRQVAELRTLLESMRDDPFQSDQSVVDTDGLEALGLEISEQHQIGIVSDTTDPLMNGGGDSGNGREFYAERRQPQLGVQASLVAPNATPGHNKPIPKKVILAMLAVSPDSFTETAPSPEAPAPMQPQRPPVHGLPTRSAQPKQAGDSDDVLAAVRNARSQRQNSPHGGLRKTRPRAGNQGPVTPGFNASMSRLGGPDDD